jgi:hypothetical protein
VGLNLPRRPGRRTEHPKIPERRRVRRVPSPRSRNPASSSISTKHRKR